ncbi:Ketosamine-3-kinase [Phlegmacium glaucopus]|nr:Ketosamine-3-kinase [Phlegmacium glaucopus]
MTGIPQNIVQKLQEIEPTASFSGILPRVISSSGVSYFVKVGSPLEQAQYAGEVESLKAMEDAAPSLSPHLFVSGVLESGSPYFISEYKELDSLSSEAAVVLAKRMATELHCHKPTTSGFGFSIPTYCGVTKLSNGWFQRWDECYSAMIGELLVHLERKGGFHSLCKKGKTMQDVVIPKLLGPLDIKPVILHGDLWSGNVGVEKSTGQPIIFDPASYYGHNEADLSIAHVFGGFPQSFFTTYHEYFAKTEPVSQYDLRMKLYQLFHYLNHTLIFGGHYARIAEREMDNLSVETSKLH